MQHYAQHYMYYAQHYAHYAIFRRLRKGWLSRACHCHCQAFQATVGHQADLRAPCQIALALARLKCQIALALARLKCQIALALARLKCTKAEMLCLSPPGENPSYQFTNSSTPPAICQAQSSSYRTSGAARHLCLRWACPAGDGRVWHACFGDGLGYMWSRLILRLHWGSVASQQSKSCPSGCPAVVGLQPSQPRWA